MIEPQNMEIFLAKWLLKLREEKGISQEALGLQLGKGQSDIAKIENGSKRVTVMEMFAWIIALNVPYERIDEVLRPMYTQMMDKKNNWNNSK